MYDAIQKVKEEQKNFYETWLADTLSMNTDEDSLFKFKLAFFKVEEIKKADNQLKKRLRKAKSVIECFAILSEVYNVESK